MNKKQLLIGCRLAGMVAIDGLAGLVPSPIKVGEGRNASPLCVEFERIG